MDQKLDFKQLTKDARERQTPKTGYRLAIIMGVKPETVYRWEKGERTPSGAHLFRLLQLAGKIVLATLALGTLLAYPAQDSHAKQGASDRAGCIM